MKLAAVLSVALAASASAATPTHPASDLLAPAVRPGDHLNSIFAKTIAITGEGFAPYVWRISGTAEDTILTVAKTGPTFEEHYIYDGFAGGKDTVEMRDRGTTFCVDGKCNPNDQTSAPLFNPLLWGAIPTRLSKGMSWPATIDRAWEIGPAGTETVRVTALDPAAGLITLERRGQGTGLSSDDAAKRPVMLTISGKPVAATVTPGPSTWQGSLTVIHGKTIADEIVLRRPVTLTAADGKVLHGEERIYTMFAQAS